MTAIMLFRQAPTYYCIWLLAFVCILFVAAASHELKSPLAVIMANVENIQNIGIAQPQAQNHLKVTDTEYMSF